MPRRSILATLVIFAALTVIGQPADRNHAGKVVLFGNLHAHSALSDDVASLQAPPADLSPLALFTYARDHGLDFLALSDHHKATDAPHRLFMTPNEYQTQLLGVASQFNQDHPGFIAIPAIEWGTTATGNHVNLIGAKSLPPDSILNEEYEELYAWARNGNVEFINFNHPNSWKRSGNRTVGNYGEKRYASVGNFVRYANPVVETMSIVSTVYKGHISGPDRHSEDKIHREMQWENLYQDYLNMGFKLAPAANQDTHWKNVGTVTAARTAVWADSATYDDLMQAFRANRAYATEDDELAVAFQVENGGRTYWMGETVDLNAQEATVKLKIKVWQVAGSDGDPTDEGPYAVDVVSDWDGLGQRRATVWDTYIVQSGQTRTIEVPVRAGEYFYLVATEMNGKDNPLGDGADEADNATGEDAPDGKRDDMNDSAWTAPIWFVR